MKADIPCPTLQVVNLSQVRSHEGYDPLRVRRLVASLNEQKFLRNPLIVTERSDRYIVLDGATRIQALRELSIPHVVVQVVNYDDDCIRLDQWNHVPIGPPTDQLLSRFRKIVGLTNHRCQLMTLEPLIESKEFIFGLIMRDGRGLAFQSIARPKAQIHQLNQVVETYRDKAHVHRTAELDLSALCHQYPTMSMVIVFKKLTPQDVIHCALNNVKLPMGITRHMIEGRALGLNIPIPFLVADKTLEYKNAKLSDMIHSRFRRNAVRLYEEATFMFDDGL